MLFRFGRQRKWYSFDLAQHERWKEIHANCHFFSRLLMWRSTIQLQRTVQTFHIKIAERLPSTHANLPVLNPAEANAEPVHLSLGPSASTQGGTAQNPRRESWCPYVVPSARQPRLSFKQKLLHIPCGASFLHCGNTT